MKRKIEASLAISLMIALFFGYALPVSADPGVYVIKNPGHWTIAVVTFAETFDPAWAYDGPSLFAITNAYDRVLMFHVDRSLPQASAGIVSEFDPMLATEWWTEDINETDPDTGVRWLQRLYFKIRGCPPTAEDPAVPWHDPAYGYLTPEDIEYTWERWMVQDRSGGSSYLLYHPLLDMAHANVTDPLMHLKIDHAIQRNESHVWINSALRHGPEGLFTKQLLTQGFGSILCKEWVTTQIPDDWPGSLATTDDWMPYHDPPISPISAAGNPMMGTGAYKLDYADWGVEWSMVRFEDYWGGWPAPGCAGYLDRVTLTFEESWEARRDMLIAGDYDDITVPRPYQSQLIEDPGPPEKYLEGIKCIYPCYPMNEAAIFLNHWVADTTMYAGGPGGQGYPPGEFHDDGIPRNFFSDLDVRLAFAHSFDYSRYVDEVMAGEAVIPGSCIPPAFTDVYNPPPDGTKGAFGTRVPPGGTGPEPYDIDYDLAVEHFKKAWGGSVAAPGPVWTEGFRVTAVVCGAVEEWVAGATILKTFIETLNPGKFFIDVLPATWDVALPALFAQELPLFLVSWSADFADASNFAHPFMHSGGTIAFCQNYTEGTHLSYDVHWPHPDGPVIFTGTSDDIIDQAALETDPDRRKAFYFAIQDIYHERVVALPTSCPFLRYWQREWCQGWYYLPITYAPMWHRWKAMPEDINADGKVNIVDVATAAAAFGSYPGHKRWNHLADIDYNAKVNIIDIAMIAAKFGTEVV